MAKSNSIAPGGAVAEFGGQNIPTVTIYMDGWVAGVRYYDKVNHKSVKVYGWYPTSKGRTADNYTGNGLFTNNFTDDDLGKTDTQNLIGEGASVIFSVAGGVGLGALAAVQSADSSSPGSVEMEWVDTDGCVSDPSGCSYFLTSVEKGIAPSVETAVLAAVHGTFKGGFYVGTLANGGVSPGSVPRLRQQDPGERDVRAQHPQGRHRERQDLGEPVQLPGGGGHAGLVCLLRLLGVTNQLS